MPDTSWRPGGLGRPGPPWVKWPPMRPRIDPFEKRRRELARKEKKQRKAERREIRDKERAERVVPDGEDPDIAGIVPGPQPPPEPIE